MDALRSANLALRFLLELGALAAVGYWGWKTSEGVMRWVLPVSGILAVVAVWILFVSPDPRISLARPVRLIIEFAVWAAAGAALYAAGQRGLAIGFVVVAIMSGTANYVWD